MKTLTSNNKPILKLISINQYVILKSIQVPKSYLFDYILGMAQNVHAINGHFLREPLIIHFLVIPLLDRGIHVVNFLWIPAFAGMTEISCMANF